MPPGGHQGSIEAVEKDGVKGCSRRACRGIHRDSWHIVVLFLGLIGGRLPEAACHLRMPMPAITWCLAISCRSTYAPLCLSPGCALSPSYSTTWYPLDF